MHIAVADGPEALTMKRLAGHLNVSVSALYNHISGKSELLLFVQDCLMGKVDVSGFRALIKEVPRMKGVPRGKGKEDHSAGELSVSDRSLDTSSDRSLDRTLDWSLDRSLVRNMLSEALRGWALSYRQVFGATPELIPLIATMPVAGAPETRKMYDAVSEGLLVCGLSEDRIIPTIVAFESFIYGSALDCEAPVSIFQSRPDEDDAPSFQRVVAAYTSGKKRSEQTISEATGVRKKGTKARKGESPAFSNIYADDSFEWGLDCLIAKTLSESEFSG